MRFAIDITPFGELADARVLADLAREAEMAGWDGAFVWDHLQGAPGWDVPIAGAWVSLAAMAAATERIRLGPMVLALPRRRPWLVAKEAASLDRLSGGRLILGAGMGYPPDSEFEWFGEPGDARTRAERLDESLAVIAGLWSGGPFAFAGRHYTVRETTLLPEPVQRPRVPVWVATTWPHTSGYARAARWDGVAPQRNGPDGWPEPFPPEELAGLRAAIVARREPGAGPFDLLVYGQTGDDPAADRSHVRELEEAGATWWAEPIASIRGSLEELRRRIRQGPPRP